MLLVHLHPVLLRDVPKHVLLLIKLQQVLSYACLCMLTDGLERFLYCTSVHCTQYRYSVLYSTGTVYCTTLAAAAVNLFVFGNLLSSPQFLPRFSFKSI